MKSVVLDPGAIAAAERVGAEAGRLDGLVDNAGAAVAGPLEALPIEEFRRQVELNLTAQLAVIGIKVVLVEPGSINTPTR